MNATESSSKRTKVANAATVEEVEALCESPELSLGALREMIGSLPPDLAIPNPSFLHRACENKKVNLGIVEYLLDIHPAAANAKVEFVVGEHRYRYAAYPLHLACINADCPSTVIAHLVRESRLALREMCLVDDGVDATWWNDPDAGGPSLGLPVHYFLTRRSNTDLDTVKLLVDAFPEALMVQDRFAPIHCLLDNPSCPDVVDIIRYFADVNPECLRLADDYGRRPIHCAFSMNYVKFAPEVVHVMLDCCPESASHVDDCWQLPIHYLSRRPKIDEETSLEILSRLLEYNPQSARIQDNDGHHSWLPIQYAAAHRPPAFCEMLVDAFPESVRMARQGDTLPLHTACNYNSVDAVKYLFDVYPEAIHVRGRGKTPLDIAQSRKGRNERIAAFLEAQLKYTNLAGDADALATQDGNGWLPLHHALRGGASLGTIKILVQGFPAALEAPGIMQNAYEFSSSDVVQLLVHLTGNRLDHFDANLNTPLHLACRGQNLEVAKYLLEECPPSVSKHNSSGKLPFHLLCESHSEVGHGGPNCIEFVWLLLLAHPEVVQMVPKGVGQSRNETEQNCCEENCVC